MCLTNQTPALSLCLRGGANFYKDVNMFSAIVWSVWAILVGGIVYLAQKQMLKENPNDAKPIKHGSIALVVFSVVIPFLLHLLTA